MESKYRFSMDPFADEKAAGSLAGGSGEDTVYLSLMSTTPQDRDEIRMDRVEFLRHALNNGFYTVSREDLAACLFQRMWRRS